MYVYRNCSSMNWFLSHWHKPGKFRLHPEKCNEEQTGIFYQWESIDFLKPFVLMYREN